MTIERLANFIGGAWRDVAADALPVVNPATASTIAEVPLSPAAEVARAAEAGEAAYREWRRVPAGERVQYLFKLKALMEAAADDLARTITEECGKTFTEARAEVLRAVENIEVASGIPSLMQGYNNEDIARGIDEHMFRQPLGVVAAITPFNFPLMVPIWFLPYAIATGNVFILKPSEKVPLSSQKLFRLLEQTGLPPGVVQLVNGGKDVVDALLDHPAVKAVSFVGSTPVARYIYSRATANGKRAQCQGGAKNPVVVLPDADMEMAAKILADAAFGCAGQRCLAASTAVTVGSARDTFVELIADIATSRRVGYGLDAGVEMGPVISQQSRERIEGLIELGRREGADVLVDGRGRAVAGYESGAFVHPTVLDGVPPGGELAGTEIFGPVLSLTHTATVEEAIALVNRNRYGNMAGIFTSSGAAARLFRVEANVGNVGINIAVPAPMAFYPFSGWGESFFGDLHGQGRHGVEFYTQTKVVVERWPKEWSRTF